MSLLIDAFIFYDELELLKFRLKELGNVVDYFVLVESDLTHSGNKKRLFYQENKHAFADFSERIVHVVHRGSEGEHIDPWVREVAQRNAIMKGLARLDPTAEDYIVISDCDEVPRAELLAEIKRHGFNIFVSPENRKYIFELSEFSLDEYTFEDELFGFLQDYYYYNLECMHADSIWWQSRIMTYRKLLERGEPDQIRRLDIGKQYYSNAGWHFSYFGGPDRIINKIQSFAHQELNKSEYLDIRSVEDSIRNNEDLFGRDFINLRHVPLASNDNLPVNFQILLNFDD
jgi:beta-1,4-mannosyl-glycoprotein beta-1,4-N-acetylglucosaminyltransferase